MWLLAKFDLPVGTATQRSRYRKFREFLLQDGYLMLQYSVYARPCATTEDVEKHLARVEGKVPKEGEVRLLPITALQFARTKVYRGESEVDPEELPDQLTLF